MTILTGIEWFFNERMSLSAEYGLSFRYFRIVQNILDNLEDLSNNSVESKATSFEISGDNVLFGISVYF